MVHLLQFLEPATVLKIKTVAKTVAEFDFFGLFWPIFALFLLFATVIATEYSFEV